MDQNKLSELSLEKLLKKRDLLKGISIGLGIVFVLGIALIIYFVTNDDFKRVPFAAFIPIFALPATSAPLLANLSSLNKEIKSRNRK